jgi:hypothetical protein
MIVMASIIGIATVAALVWGLPDHGRRQRLADRARAEVEGL